MAPIQGPGGGRYTDRMMLGRVLIAGALAWSGCSSQATPCDVLRSQIDAKIRATGVTQFSLNVVDSDAAVPGRNVGSCELGARKIVYLQTAAGALAAPPPPGRAPIRQRPRNDALLTECKDGSVSVGGSCKK